MSKRLTVIYEVPDDYQVTRITGTGELEVVQCVSDDLSARLAEADKHLEEVEERFSFAEACVKDRDARLAAAEAERDGLRVEQQLLDGKMQMLGKRLAAAEALNEQIPVLTQAVAEALANFGKATKRLAAAEARLRVYEPEPGKCEHGVAEGDWCEPCNKAYKEAADEAAKGGGDE